MSQSEIFPPDTPLAGQAAKSLCVLIPVSLFASMAAGRSGAVGDGGSAAQGRRAAPTVAARSVRLGPGRWARCCTDPALVRRMLAHCFRRRSLNATRKRMTLQTLETKWREYLAAESCPPVLGLAPLSEEESEVIRQLVANELGQGFQPPWQTLFALLWEFPACLAVWLARKAGEAYEAGAFHEKCGTLTGVAIPLNQRAEFAKRFRRACRKTMAGWLPPAELGGHHIVAEFLHQAGLPLDRCDGFAQHVRKVERSLGLPDADASDAGEQLREAVLDSLQPISFPTLKRALRGPAGPRICEVALSVVLKGGFAGINPRLGRELERAFEHDGGGALRRSAHQPFLRLGEDFGSLEIVGPRQDPNLIGASGLTWVVDGRRIPTPRNEEFLVKVTERPRVVLELAGVVLGALPPRTFVLRLDDLAEPFILFDERTRRQRRVGVPLPAGRYWLLHRAGDMLVGAEQRYDWLDGERVLSLFRVRPATEARLESGEGVSWRFTAALIPFFDAVGERLAHEAGEPVCFGWSEMPFIWLPTDEMDEERFAQWRVFLRDGDVEHTGKLTRTNDEAGGMSKCRVAASEFLAARSPGLHRLEIALRRGERSRVEAQTDYWYWQGLVRRDAEGFHFVAKPENLLQEECRGFSFGETAICHLTDTHRRHTLTFEVGGDSKAFHWSQPGVFLESLERRDGQQAVARSHHLGEAFSASLNSDRWLRIWLAGQTDWAIIVAGQAWQREIGGDQREFVELSLASLATAFPQGGEIQLRLGESERVIARFTSPLQPVTLDAVGDETHKGFRFCFAEPVAWIRPVLRELASGQRPDLDGQQFGTSGHCVFAIEGLPQIECSNLVAEALPGADLGHPLTLNVPKQDWPVGLWLVELEVRRDEHADWESVVLRGRDHAPVFVCARNGEDASTPRGRMLWASSALGNQLPDDFALDDHGCAQLVELLQELIVLRQQNMVAEARRDMSWLKDAVRSLSRLAGRIARQAQGSGLQTKLLNLACQDSSHAGFVHLPGLLALAAGEYRELPAGDPLNDALRRCGRLAAADSVVEAVRHDLGFLDLGVIACFANFAQVVATRNGEPSALELNRFAHERYWQSVLGTLQCDQLAADWSGEGALGKAHTVWALAELVRRYDHNTHKLNPAAANALLHCAPDFRAWLHQQLATKSVMSTAAWNAPWPRFTAPEVDFLDGVPRFASLFALSARAAAAGLLDFDETLTWLERHAERRWMAEEGIAVLVGLAPELFGHQLLFWELIVRTVPH